MKSPMHPRVFSLLGIAGLLCAAGVLIPPIERSQPPPWLALVGAVMGLCFRLVLLGIAWTVGERTPRSSPSVAQPWPWGPHFICGPSTL